jgi:hypothetical protein
MAADEVEGLGADGTRRPQHGDAGHQWESR